jgi:hypothetical protein
LTAKGYVQTMSSKTRTLMIPMIGITIIMNSTLALLLFAKILSQISLHCEHSSLFSIPLAPRRNHYR